jgi:hypothetical protein
MCVAELEACFDRGTKETKVFVEVYSIGYNFLVITNELHLDNCY